VGLVSETYPRTWGQYVLLERLGAGWMSEVDLARKMVDDGSFVRFTVIKRIKADKTQDEGFVRMFKDEARITSELHHAKIGTVYDFGKVGDEYFLALEYVPGMDARYLVNVLRERGQRVPVKVALRIMVDVLEALEYAHTKKDMLGKRMGIVHRDVNPRNVMISIRGEVKLIDFGVAKATDRLEHTRTDHVKGKLSYMAPEQISGLSTDHRADIYAAGLMLHELLAGTSPFYGLNQVQILHRMLSGKPPPLPTLAEVTDPAMLERIQAKAMAQSVSDRYASAGTMADDLRAFAVTQLGGLPSNDQLAAFLANVDPELTARLQFKMEAYARAETSQPIQIEPGTLQEAMLPESNSTLGPAPPLEADSLTVTRIGVLGGSFLLVSVLSALFAAVFVSLVLVGGFLYLRPEGPPPPPEPFVAAPQPLPDPVPPVPAVVAPAPEVAPTAAAPLPAPTQPAPVRPVPAEATPPQPTPPDPVVEVAPAPAVVVPDPVPEPAPALPPADVGMLSVNSDPRGVVVLVDGVEVGRTPLERFKVTVGPHTVEVPGLTCSQRAVTIRKSVVVGVTCK
jgi:serine/threonine protein kinase